MNTPESEALIDQMVEAMTHIPRMSESNCSIVTTPDRAMTFEEFQAINQEDAS